MLKTVVAWARSLVFALLASNAVAQEFPTGTVKIVVPFASGSSIDSLARATAEELTRRWGHPVIIENRPGASTIIGTDYVAKSAPDGHTLLFATTGVLAINPAVYKRLPYDPVRSFAPISVLTNLTLMLAVNPSLPAGNLREFVSLAKAKPNSINYGSSGIGHETHVSMEQFTQLAGIKLWHVPYKAIVQLMPDVAAGTIQAVFIGPAAHRLVRAGKIKALAIAGEARSALLPEVPTFKEQGYDFVFASWWGLVAPAGTPQDVVTRIHRDVVGVIKDKQFKAKRLDPLSLEAVGNSPEEFAAQIQAEISRWKGVANVASISLEY